MTDIKDYDPEWDKLSLPEKIRQCFTMQQQYIIWRELADWIEKHEKRERHRSNKEKRHGHINAE